MEALQFGVGFRSSRSWLRITISLMPRVPSFFAVASGSKTGQSATATGYSGNDEPESSTHGQWALCRGKTTKQINIELVYVQIICRGYDMQERKTIEFNIRAFQGLFGDPLTTPNASRYLVQVAYLPGDQSTPFGWGASPCVEHPLAHPWTDHEGPT